MKKGKQNCLMILMPPVTSTIEEGKKYLRENWDASKGVDCPCCGQLVKLYNRKLHSVMAACLVRMYRLDRQKPNEYFYAGEIINGIIKTGTGDLSKLRYWGLIAEQPKDDSDESRRTSGFWAITEKGRRFVETKITVPSHLKMFDGKFFGFSEDHITIHHALGDKFNYMELIGDAINRNDPPQERLL